MNAIINPPYEDIDLELLSLGNPYTSNNTIINDILFDKKNCYIQTPSCQTKNGLEVTNNGTKYSVDLIFSAKNTDFIDFIQRIEERIQNCIFEKRNLWFDTELSRADIEQAFVSSFKVSRKMWTMRASNVYKKHDIVNVTPSNMLSIFDDDQKKRDVKDVTKDKNVILLIHPFRVKASSFSFSIDYQIKQIMIETEEKFDNCLISHPKRSSVEERKEEENLDEVEVKPVEEENPIKVMEEAKEKAEEDLVDIITSEEAQIDVEDLDEPKEDVELKLDVIDVNLDEPFDDLIKEAARPSKPLPETGGIKLRNEDEVVMEMYLTAKKKAKDAKKMALDAYLEAQKIKEQYGIKDDSDYETD